MKPVAEKLLSPRLLTDSDFSYESVKELKDAVSQDSCKNIAVTGVYGAGKSSVINTFISELEKDNPKKRILRVSLSTFDLADNTIADKKYENDIEYKLVQQILYRSNPDELYQSSFRRIPYRPIECVPKLALFILISFAALVVLFEPSFLRIESLYDLYYLVLGKTAGEWINRICDVLSLGWLVYISYRIFAWGIRRITSWSSVKLRAKDYELELSKDSSVFSKMLEELFYFFKAGKYDVVVIEDLDRLCNPENLFLKIRELNIMFNEAYAFCSEGKPIKFIYAVRDDLFKSDIRVKFFDYIVPVVPIIDSHNAADYILEKRPDLFEGKESFKQDIPEIVHYINEKRVLQNVLNEYELYHKTILTRQDNLSESKLLAMMVYKNMWPDNYSMLHSRSSILNKLFDDPKPVVEELFGDEVVKQANLEKELRSLEEEAKTIRRDFVGYLAAYHNVDSLISDSFSYTLDDLIENDYCFVKLQNDKFEEYVYVDRLNKETGARNVDFTFEDIEDAIDQDGSKIERLGQLRDSLRRKEAEKGNIDKELAHKMASSYKEILIDVDGDDALQVVEQHAGKDAKKELSEFILSMLRKGYIAEDYHKYISFYYEGAISSKDSSFINAVLQGRSLDYDYKLDNPQEVRKQLEKEDNYSGNSILNYSFIEYLMEKKDPFLENITKVARRNWGFINGYDIFKDNNADFLKNHVFNGWNSCLRDLFSGDKKSLADNLQVFFHYCPDNVDMDGNLKNSLSSLYEVVANGITSISAPLVASWMSSKGIVFKTIRTPISEYEKPLFEEVLKEGLFEITKNNLSVIFGKIFEEAAYTTICNCGNDELISYLESHIDLTVHSFPDSSINEVEEHLKELLNKEQIEIEWKESYLRKQQCIMHDLKDLSKDAAELLFKVGKIEVSWKNIYTAVEMKIQDALRGFIASNVSELSSLKCELDVNLALAIEKTLFSSNDYLSLDSFGSLAPCFSVQINPDLLSGLDNDRMLLMVKYDLVMFIESGLELLASYNIPVIGQYVVDHFEQYKEYYDTHNDFCDNAFGLYLLKSSMTKAQKQYYLDKMAPTELDEDEYYYDYSKQICVFLNEVGISSDTDVDLVVNALVGYSGNEGWYEKISLINKINGLFEYDEEREKKMINALGGGYLPLNTYYGAITLDNNPQNFALLKYLVENNHFVNRFYLQDDDRLKVTFKRAPQKS